MKGDVRMKKSAVFLLVLVLSSLLVLVSAFSQEDMVVMDESVFEKPQRPPAGFKHDEHNELAGIEACYECHHVYDDDGKLVEDESSEDQSCSECHDLQASDGKPALMKAFHANCKGCHREKKKGPIMCGQCHVRNPVI
jgi:hypothetical protein